MSNSLDFNIFSISRYATQFHPELLALYVTEPPRSTARGRGTDRLVFYLSMQGNAPLPPAKQEQVLAELVKIYYKTPGSVTTGLRTIIEQLNGVLLERNLRLSSNGQQGMGLFAAVVIREGQIYMAHAGPLKTFLIGANETRQFYDPSLNGQSLGQGRGSPVSFYQAVLLPNDTLIMAVQPSPEWSSVTLTGIHGQGPESLRRRFFAQEDVDLNAVLIQAKPGKGKFFVRPFSFPITAVPEEPSKAVESKPVLESTASVSALPVMQKAPRMKGFLSIFVSLWKVMVAIGMPIVKLSWNLTKGVKSLIKRIPPVEPFKMLPSSVMAIIAIAIPIVIVTVAIVAYSHLGRTAQYELLFKQSQQMAGQATSQTDVIEQRASWNTLLEILSRAETYRITPETKELRLHAREALDKLDLVRRINYQPAIIGGLPASVYVTRIIIANNDIYMLDGNTGTVLRARYRNLGYELDSTFECGSSDAVISMTGAIIDIVPWPVGYKPEADLLALDAKGNLLYCLSDGQSVMTKLGLPPVGSWGSLVGFALDTVDLYLLDPPSNAVWTFWNNEYIASPHFYFDKQIPFMQDLTDIEVNRADLYLLHADGHITLCVLSSLGVPHCSDSPFIDSRPGRENSPITLKASFTQLLFAPPPDPSLLFLEPQSQAIYHFSSHNLMYQNQYLPSVELSNNEATAFGIDIVQRYLFLAIGNEVYYGAIP
jgi:hypothetical protein